MKFTHHTTDPFVLDRNRQYEQPDHISTFTKPEGLWVSVDGDWERYCSGKCYGEPEDGHYRQDTFGQEASLSLDLTEVLVVSSTQEMRDFGETYRVERHPRIKGINWPRVADWYKGILITPELWEMRLGQVEEWYYTWDCASACIWDLSAVEVIETSERQVKELV